MPLLGRIGRKPARVVHRLAPMTNLRRKALSVFALLTLAAACTGTPPLSSASPGASVPTPLPSPTPSGTPGGSPRGTGPLDSIDEAVERILALDPRYALVPAFDPDAIGQAIYYQATATDAGYEVAIRVGWGDCPAGCINEHTWIYGASPAGLVTLIGETGDPVPADVFPSPADAGSGTLELLVTAGPTCPVETQPPDPACAARPVPEAEFIVRDIEGVEVGRGVSDADGRLELTLPPGQYTVEAQQVTGFMAAPEPQMVTIAAGARVPLAVSYDTGIR